ncbi:TOR complex subunit lst8 [Emmonsiellopsis sp. PD_33]|nr:TOR complex subunit lst8 [Emmonsiellopsis sp. PD_33]
MSVILCTAGYDHTIRFWEALSGICSRTIQHSDSQVNRLCITPDKRYVAAAGRDNVKLYDIKSTNPNPVITFDGHTNNVTGVAFHCEGKWMVTSSEDGTVKVWDTRIATIQRNYVHQAPVNDVVIHPNQGELITCDRAGFVRVWDLGESKCTHQLQPEEDVSMASVSVASDGSLLCAGNNKGNVYLWRMIQDRDVTKIVPFITFQAHKDYLTRVLLSPDVKHLATCSADHTAKVWSLDPEYGPARDATEGNPRAEATENEKTKTTSPPVAGGDHHAGAIHPVNDIFLGASQGADKPLTETNEATNVFPTPPDAPIDPNTNAPYLEATLANHQRWVWDCAFSADSAYLVTVCSDHYARLWELSSGQIIRQYSGHHRGAVCVALNDYSEPR